MSGSPPLRLLWMLIYGMERHCQGLVEWLGTVLSGGNMIAQVDCLVFLQNEILLWIEFAVVVFV